MRKKIYSYLGFAKKSRSLVTGYNTCAQAIQKRKIKLLILTEDLSENTLKKLKGLAERNNVPCRIYGSTEELSEITGGGFHGVFGIIDENFAKVILKEIDQE